MKRYFQTLLLVALVGTGYAEAPVKVEGEYGILNPDDTGREMLARKIEMGVIDSVTCSLGVNTSKYDDHKLARRLATQCAEAGFTKAMTWMSQFEANGIGGENNPIAAAEWDRRAAEAGDPVGMYNYGLDLMRGYGVAKDEALARLYIDQAVEGGLDIAKRLQEVGYDVDEVTPDIDNWKFEPMTE